MIWIFNMYAYFSFFFFLSSVVPELLIFLNFNLFSIQVTAL